MRLTACVVAVLLWLWFAWYILSFVNPIWLMFFFQSEIIITFGSICVDAFGIWNLVRLRGSIFLICTWLILMHLILFGILGKLVSRDGPILITYLC